MTDFLAAFLKPTRKQILVTPHHLIPGQNRQQKICTNHVWEHGTSFPLVCVRDDLLLPASELPNSVRRGRDPATHLVHRKYKWEERNVLFTKQYKKRANNRIILETLHGKVMAGIENITVPGKLIRFIKHVSNDPDPFFDGVYNWYYCEGTVTTVHKKDQVYLISVQGQHLDKICMVPLKQNADSWEARHHFVTRERAVIQKKPIYQLKGIEVQNRVVIGVRQRDVISIYFNNLRRVGLKLVPVHTSNLNKNEKPFTGMDIDPCNLGHYCVSNSDRMVRVWDSSYQKPVLMEKAVQSSTCNKSVSSGWCGVWYDSDNPNLLLVADRCCVTWHDTRCGLSETVRELCIHSSKNSYPLEFSCEELSLVMQSPQHEYRMYLGMTHSLLQLDKRHPTICPKPVRQWTHMLNGQVLLGQVAPIPGGNTELVCVACPQQAVMVLGGELCCSIQPPLGIPSLAGTPGITGLGILPEPDAKGYGIITEIGNGDVRGYWMRWRDGPLPEVSGSAEPSHHSESVKCQTLQATSRRDMEVVFSGLRSSEKVIPTENYSLLKKRQPWQRSKAQLQSYVDVLAPTILDVWGLEEMPEWQVKAVVPSSVDKVRQWLQANLQTDNKNRPHSTLQETEASQGRSESFGKSGLEQSDPSLETTLELSLDKSGFTKSFDSDLEIMPGKPQSVKSYAGNSNEIHESLKIIHSPNTNCLEDSSNRNFSDREEEHYFVSRPSLQDFSNDISKRSKTQVASATVRRRSNVSGF